MNQPVRRTSLTEEVRLALRERILRGQLVAGDRIVEQTVAREMGTSQGPVREALAFLCQEGLLITLPHRGTFVSEVSEVEARMAYAIREKLEPLAVGRALEADDDGLLPRLEAHLEQMRAAGLAGDTAELIAADMAFHSEFYALAGTDVLMATWQTVSATIRKFVAVASPQYYRHAVDAAEDHVILIQLAREQDIPALLDATVDHLHNIWRRMGLESTAER